MQVTSL
jgi:hypothetical protein